MLIEEGIEQTEREGVEPRDLEIKAWQSLLDLSRLAKEGAEVRLFTGEREHRITRSTGEILSRSISRGYRDKGSVEGYILAVSQIGVPHVLLEERSHGSIIRCEVRERVLEQCSNLMSSRVEAHGLIHYRRDGSIEKVMAERIERFPDRSELPQVSDIRGIYAGID